MIGGGFTVGLLALLVRGNATVASVDSSVAEWGNAHATHLSTRALYWVTDLGDWPIVILVGVASGFSWWVYRDTAHESVRAA